MKKYIIKLLTRDKTALRLHIPKNIRNLYSNNIPYIYREDFGLQLFSKQYSEDMFRAIDKVDGNSKFANFIHDIHYNHSVLKVRRNVVKIPQSLIDKVGNGCVNISFNRDMITVSHIKNTGTKSVCVGADENGEGGIWMRLKR